MNDLGIALAWLSVQVTLVLVPALALVALASRRGPGAGAWVSTLGLGLVSALSVTSLIGVAKHDVEPLGKTAAVAQPTRATAPPAAVEAGRGPDLNIAAPSVPGWDLSRLRSVWDRLGRGAAEPAARVRPWGSVLAVLTLAGMGYSLVRLLAGLLAVAVCSRRGRLIDDPEMAGLLDRLRDEMGCFRSVELREAADLTTPATAGWRRPVVLLPEDWRGWTVDERRAVLAHELAHVVRGDYAAGLVARLAVVLNTYHPLVRWLAGRLELQQEQAADALAARFAGGRSRYLVALARLALEQDGRSPRWPAREFLPDRGTLIRRIAMLRDQSESGSVDRSNPGTWRLPASFTLIDLTVGVAMLRGPARAEDERAPNSDGTNARMSVAHEPIKPPYVPEGAVGLIAFRPAPMFQRMGEGEAMLSLIPAEAAADLELDQASTKRGSPALSSEDVEWASIGIHLDNVKNEEDGDFQFQLFSFRGLTIRMSAPFDWLAYLRQFLELSEVREGGRAYYRIQGAIRARLGDHPCLYVLDDRTLVQDEEDGIRALVTNTMPAQPVYLRSPEWERASRGLLAYAIGNEDGSFEKRYHPERPRDATFLSLFNGVEHWVLGIDDAEPLTVHAGARCRDLGTSTRLANEIETLLKDVRTASDKGGVVDDSWEAKPIINRMAKPFLANVRIEHTDRTIGLGAEDFGSFADLASIFWAYLGR